MSKLKTNFCLTNLTKYYYIVFNVNLIWPIVVFLEIISYMDKPEMLLVWYSISLKLSKSKSTMSEKETTHQIYDLLLDKMYIIIKIICEKAHTHSTSVIFKIFSNISHVLDNSSSTLAFYFLLYFDMNFRNILENFKSSYFPNT